MFSVLTQGGQKIAKYLLEYREIEKIRSEMNIDINSFSGGLSGLS